MRYEMDGDLYCQVDSHGQILAKLDVVAVAFSYDEGGAILMKHGSPSMVNRWVAEARAKFKSVPVEFNMANNLMVIDGRFEINDLNRIISTSGYLTQFLKKIGFQSVTPAAPVSSFPDSLEP